MPSRRGSAADHTSSTESCTPNIKIGQNAVQAEWMRLNSPSTSALRSWKRFCSRRSWLNALTTRMPGMVSDSTSVRRDHLRQARKKSSSMFCPFL